MKGETAASLKAVVEKIYGEGMIHVTIQRIRRSSGPPQAEFYCGDKQCHVMSSRVIVDADGLMVTGIVLDHCLVQLFNLMDENSPPLYLYRLPPGNGQLLES